MTTEQMEKGKKEQKPVDKKKRKRKPRESWKHFRHDDIELFKLGNVKEQKPIYSKLRQEKQIFVPNFEKPVTRTRLRSLINANQNNKSLEHICDTLQNKISESAKDNDKPITQTSDDSDNPEKGQLRIFLKQAKDSHQYEIVFNNETTKSDQQEQPSLPSQCVGRHNLPIQITERRKSIAEPLTRFNIHPNPSKISEDTLKPETKETIPSFIRNEIQQNSVSTEISNKNTTTKDPTPQNALALLPSKGTHQADEPYNLSINNKSPVLNNTSFWTSNQSTPKPIAFTETNKVHPKKQPRGRPPAGTRAKKQNTTQKNTNALVPPVPFQNGGFFSGQPTPQITGSIANPFEAYYRRLQAPPTKETPIPSFYPLNPFIPPIPNINFPLENPASEDFRQRRALEESMYQRPYLINESNTSNKVYTLPGPPVPPPIEQERMLLNSLDILNNYRAMNLNTAQTSNSITVEPMNNLVNSLPGKYNNPYSLFPTPFMNTFPLAQPRINEFPSSESAKSPSNNRRQQEPNFLLNNKTNNSTTSISQPFPTYTLSTPRNPTPADASLMHMLYRQEISKPPPYSEKPTNPPPYSEAVKTTDQIQPTNFMCGILTPPSSSLDVLEISEEHDSSRRNVTSKPMHPTVSHTSTSTITDVNNEPPVVDFPTPNEEIPQPVLNPIRHDNPQQPISLSNLPRNSVIKANFSVLNSNKVNRSSVGVTTPNSPSNPKSAIGNDSKAKETKKLKEISTQTDFSVDSISHTSTGRVQNEDSIKTTKRKFSEEAKDEILNKLKALSSNPLLTRRDEIKIDSNNRQYENVTPVNFPTGDENGENTAVFSKKTTDNVVVILEDSSNEAVMKNEEIILIEDSSDEAENNETVMKHCPSEIQKAEPNVDNKSVELNSKIENADVVSFANILPPLNDSATLEPDEYVNEIKALEKNETPSEFYDFYLFVTKKQILNNQKPISFKIFLEFQNAGSLKAMEEAYKIYMIKSEK